MRLVGQSISHIKFGDGVITNKKDRLITVHFVEGEKKFHFPDAFEKFLIIKNEKLQKQIDEEVETLVGERKKREEAKWQEKAYHERIRTLKINANSQVAFGLKINDRKQVFSSWTVSTGAYLSGKSKGMPRIPIRVNLNSACLLTFCPDGLPEQSRKIIGMFMVKSDFNGKLCEDGVIQSHDKYRIQMHPTERLDFWDYFSEDAGGCKWGNTEMHYFSNKTMKQILKDLQEKITDEQRKMMVSDFYDYFLRVNKMTDDPENELPIL